MDKNLLMQDPIKLVQESRFKKLDIMIGTTKDDGAIVTMGTLCHVWNY